MWVLLLNDMRSSKSENLQPVVRAETKEALKAFVESQKVEPYVTDGTRVLHHTTDSMAGTTEVTDGYKWGKSFKFGGPLEWFNKPNEFNDNNYVDVGTEDSWVEAARNDYRNQIVVIPTIPL
jgi:hypothetical protein